MASPTSKADAINVGPNAASSSSQMNRDMAMASGSPPSGAYSPPVFMYTSFEGTASEAEAGMNGTNGMTGLAVSSSGSQHDRRYSDEWDASKVPPSRFQKRKGSIYSTPGSRDGHVDNNYATKFHAKHAELGYNKIK